MYPTIYLFPSLFKQRSANGNRRGKASNCNRYVTGSQPNYSVQPSSLSHEPRDTGRLTLPFRKGREQYIDQ